MTMTEFNRNPSRAARLARTEAVIITDHGVPSLRIDSLLPMENPLDRLVKAGRATPPSRPRGKPFPRPEIHRDLVREAIANWEAERDERAY